MRNRLTAISSALATACGATLVALALPAAAVPYTFDDDNMNWSKATITDDPGYETVNIDFNDAQWESESGNGFIKARSTVNTLPRAYNLGIFGDAPTLLGDLTGRLRVQADFRREGTFESLVPGDDPTVRLILSDATASPDDTTGFDEATWYYSSVQSAPRLNNVGTDWGTYSFDLDPANFFVWPNGMGGSSTTSGTTARSFGDMLNSYSYIGFTILSEAEDESPYGLLSSGNTYTLPDYGAIANNANFAEFHVDNVSVPEPGTLALFGAIAVGWVGARRRKA